MKRFTIPMLQAYGNMGDFTVAKRIKSALKVNIKFYLMYVVVGFFGLLYLVFGNGYTSREKIQVYVMAMANSWGLFLVIIFMGYGLVALPRRLWFSGNRQQHLHQLYLKAPRVKEEYIDSELEFNELAKTMNSLAHRTSLRDPSRHLVDQMVAWFPFVLDQSYNDRENRIHIPQLVTEEYLVNLNRNMIWCVRMKERKLALWKNLLQEAFYLQDIISNRDNPDHLFHSNLQGIPSSHGAEFKSKIEWAWVTWLGPFVYRILAVICTVISICILWSELTFNIEHPVLSIVGLLLEACGFNYAAVEFLALFTLTYMCLCVYTSLFKFRLFNLYLLIPNHHTDANSLLWFTSYMCKMMAPLCYNFVNLSGNTSTADRTIFSQFMGHANLLPFLGDTFVDRFPVVILLPVILVLFNIQGQCLSLCGVNGYTDKNEQDEEISNRPVNADAAEGKALIDEGRTALERIIHPELEAQRNVFERARNLFGVRPSQ
ncbi:LMBR1-like membrane protein-domain-containing protein [Spinellus fusiger]|nr:LMBR1-like membrane protein-domain-containing protein [Spinellus fusiger]